MILFKSTESPQHTKEMSLTCNQSSAVFWLFSKSEKFVLSQPQSGLLPFARWQMGRLWTRPRVLFYNEVQTQDFDLVGPQLEIAVFYLIS